jgi:hypothetical protein
MNLFFIIFFGGSWLVLSQFLVKNFLNWLNSRINNYLPEAERLAKEAEANGYRADDFKRELANFYVIKQKRKKLWLFAATIGAFETIVFSCLTVLYLNKFGLDPLRTVVIMIQFGAGWVAMKTFGNYQQWSGAVFGRLFFYIFIIGSILNIGLAVVLGYLLSFFFLK